MSQDKISCVEPVDESVDCNTRDAIAKIVVEIQRKVEQRYPPPSEPTSLLRYAHRLQPIAAKAHRARYQLDWVVQKHTMTAQLLHREVSNAVLAELNSTEHSHNLSHGLAKHLLFHERQLQNTKAAIAALNRNENLEMKKIIEGCKHTKISDSKRQGTPGADYDGEITTSCIDCGHVLTVRSGFF